MSRSWRSRGQRWRGSSSSATRMATRSRSWSRPATTSEPIENRKTMMDRDTRLRTGPASGQDSVSSFGIERRSLLKTSAVLTGVLVAQGAIGLLAPSLAWALEVKTIDQKQADTVLRLAKVLYPHEGLEDAV